MSKQNDKAKTAAKQYYLGKMNINWADEIDFVFIDVYDENGKKDLIDALRKLGNDEIHLCFGTNEDADYSGNDLLDSIEWIKIPDDATRKFIENKVCDYNNSIDDILESLWDDEEYEDDEEGEDEDEEENA